MPATRMASVFAQLLHGQREHRLVEPDLRIADLELRGVDADRDAARARGQIIARERALPPLVQLALGVERQRMRGNHHAVAAVSRASVPCGHQNLPSRVSKCVGLSCVAPPMPIQSATHLDHLLHRHRRIAEQPMAARGVAQQRRVGFRALEESARCRSVRRSCCAIQRTDTVSGPVTFSTTGGDWHSANERRQWSSHRPARSR